MSENKYPPGEWECEKTPYYSDYNIYSPEYGRIATIICRPGEEKMAKGTAELICNSPKLLKCCKMALNFLGNTENEFGIELPSAKEIRSVLKNLE